MTIGQFIKETRLKKGMTQEELATKTDISVRTIQRIENGDVDPRSFTLQAIASVLDIDYKNLMNCENKNFVNNNSTQSKIWLPILHLSGLFLTLLIPLIIWLLQKDKNKIIREQGIDVINFQLSMLIYLIPTAILIIPAILIGIFSTVIIIINTIKVINNQPYKYPLTIKILKS